MAQTVTVSKRIRRPTEEVAAFVADPHRLIPVVTTVGRCEYIGSEDQDDHDQLWDVFLVSGTLHLGGRVRVTRDGSSGLRWRSLRGTRHSLEARVDGGEQACRVIVSLTFSLTGLGIARLSELIGRGIVARNLQAATEELRHRLEFEEGESPLARHGDAHT
jgi:hypothetical protein